MVASLQALLPPTSWALRLGCAPQNPRVLLLFRFVSDVLGAVSIISSAAKKTEDSAAAAGTAAAAAGAPAAGAVAAEAIKGAAAATGEAAAAAVATDLVGAAPPARSSPPLEVLIELHNLGIVLPTTAYSSSTLGATVEHLLIALPGGRQPGSLGRRCAVSFRPMLGPPLCLHLAFLACSRAHLAACLPGCAHLATALPLHSARRLRHAASRAR